MTNLREVKKTVTTPLALPVWKSVVYRFFKAFIPQIPGAVIIGLQADNFWLPFLLAVLASMGTALDKAFREKDKAKRLNS